MIPPKIFNIFHSVKRYYLTLTRLVISCKSFRKLSIVLVISWEMSTLWLVERWRDRDTCGTALSVTWPFGMFSIGSVALLGTSVVSWYSSWSLWSDSSLLGETERDDERLEMNRIGEFSLEALNDSLVRLEMSLSSRVYLEESLVGTWLVPKRLRQPIPNRRNWSRPVRWWGLQGNSPPCQNSSWSPLSFWVKLSQHFAIRLKVKPYECNSSTYFFMASLRDMSPRRFQASYLARPTRSQKAGLVPEQVPWVACLKYA